MQQPLRATVNPYNTGKKLQLQANPLLSIRLSEERQAGTGLSALHSIVHIRTQSRMASLYTLHALN